MKTLILITCFIFAINFLTAQSIQITASQPPALNPSQVPPAAITSFTNENPGISGTWRAEEKNYRVNYIDPNTKLARIIIYDKDGKVVRRENEVDNTPYPGNIKDSHERKYPSER